jgi:hypothetical protein
VNKNEVEGAGEEKCKKKTDTRRKTEERQLGFRLEARGINLYGRLIRQNSEKHNSDNDETIRNEAFRKKAGGSSVDNIREI